tara:strand:- start:295 stop:588 length:294 start_codon:yes stop_codon:yes gene_type:complete
MITKVIAARNLTNACKKVVQNKGSAGMDGMTTDKLKAFIDAHRSEAPAPNVITFPLNLFSEFPQEFGSSSLLQARNENAIMKQKMWFLRIFSCVYIL